MRAIRVMTGMIAAVAAVMALVGAAVQAADPKSYGKGVSISEATPLRDLLATPSKFEGKTVRVEGYVTAVCEEMGCWMALAPSQAKDDKSLIIQVEHGVVMFPMSAKGSRAAAQGVVQRVGSHQSREAAEELAKQQGTSVADVGQWHIHATGALIY
ncbi:MAG: DUF4920 domain-containing protein [Acidimicrobiia bacterium]|nr:DUF4920 domain-containing protein [Acidimicrobiia bacterium]